MAINHLLSQPLFDELFRHNVISSDGRIIANDQELKKYSTFLFEQSRNRRVEEYKIRKCLVDKVQKHLKARHMYPQNEDELESSLSRLGMHFTKEGNIAQNKPSEPPKKYLGPSYPNLSLWERRSAAHMISQKVQKSDLKVLDDWLNRICNAKTKKMAPKSQSEGKQEEFKYRAKTENFLQKVAKSRLKLVEQHHRDINRKWVTIVKKVLDKVALSESLSSSDVSKSYTEEYSSPTHKLTQEHETETNAGSQTKISLKELFPDNVYTENGLDENDEIETAIGCMPSSTENSSSLSEATDAEIQDVENNLDENAETETSKESMPSSTDSGSTLSDYSTATDTGVRDVKKERDKSSKTKRTK